MAMNSVDVSRRNHSGSQRHGGGKASRIFDSIQGRIFDKFFRSLKTAVVEGLKSFSDEVERGESSGGYWLKRSSVYDIRVRIIGKPFGDPRREGYLLGYADNAVTKERQDADFFNAEGICLLERWELHERETLHLEQNFHHLTSEQNTFRSSRTDVLPATKSSPTNDVCVTRFSLIVPKSVFRQLTESGSGSSADINSIAGVSWVSDGSGTVEEFCVEFTSGKKERLLLIRHEESV